MKSQINANHRRWMHKLNQFNKNEKKLHFIKNSTRQSRARIRRVNFFVGRKILPLFMWRKIASLGKSTGLIGEKLCKEKVYKDGKAPQTCYTNKSFLTNLNILRFIKERNKLLVRFLCGVSGLEFSVESEQIQYAFASTLEMCYYLRNLNLVLPHCFLGNLVQSRISGSKSVSVVNGKLIDKLIALWTLNRQAKIFLRIYIYHYHMYINSCRW